MEFVNESRGLYARKPSDPAFLAASTNAFGAEANDPFAFVGITNFPESGSYANEQQRNAAITAFEHSGKPIMWTNVPNRARLAFAVAEFSGPDGRSIYFGRYFDQITNYMMGKWSNADLPGLIPQLGGSKKMQAGLTPVKVLGRDLNFESVDDLLEAVRNSTVDERIKDGLLAGAESGQYVFKNSKDLLPAIRDNLGEIIQAIAVCKDQIDAPELAEAMQDALGDVDDFTVEFPASMNAGLADFVVKKPGQSITLDAKQPHLKVSSKGGSGAKASVKNIYDGMQLVPDDELKRDHEFAAFVLSTVANSSQEEGPLTLATDERMGSIITEQHASMIRELLRSRSQTLTAEQQALANDIRQLYSPPPEIKAQDWTWGHYLLSLVARKVADTCNANAEFSASCLDFLARLTVIQLYTDVGVEGQNVVVKGFRAQYPARFTGSAYIDASKGYYSTGIKQKFTFGFKSG